MALEATTWVIEEHLFWKGAQERWRKTNSSTLAAYIYFLREKMYCQMSSYAKLGKASSFPNLRESPWKEGGKRIKTIFLRSCSFIFPSTVVPHISSSFPGDISKCGCSSICHHAFIQSCNRKSFLLNVKISMDDHSSICDIFSTLQNWTIVKTESPFFFSKIHLHIGSICIIFLQNEFSRVPSHSLH